MKTGKARFFEFRRFFMDLGRLVCSPLLLVWRFRKITPDGKPYRGAPKGGVLVAANHTSFMDPLAMGTCFWRRRVFFMASEEVMSIPFFKVLLKGMGCLKIDRVHHDIDGIKKAVSVLKEGRMVTIFPQGGIVRQEEEIHALKTGVLLLAMQADVPVLPVYTKPALHWWRRRVAVIGEPLVLRQEGGPRFLSAAAMEELSLRLQSELNRCREIFDRQQGE